MQNNRGIGLVAAIVILAIIGVGGYAAVRATQNAHVEVDTADEEQKGEDVLASVRTDVANTLTGIQADIRANADVAVSAALGTLSELSARIQNSFSRVDASARAELEAMKSQVDGISAELDSDVSTAEVSIDSMLQGLRAYVRGGSGAEVGTEAGSDDDAMEDDDTMEADVEAGAGAEVDDDGADVEGDASGELSL